MKIVFLVIALLQCVFAFEVSVAVDRSEVSIADPLRWTLEVRTEKEGEVELPGIVGNFGAFEIKNFQVFPPEKKGEQTLYSWEYNLATFLSGEYIIPPQLVVFHPQGAESDSLATNSVTVKVLSTLNQDMEDILDVEPVLEASKPWFNWLLMALGVLAAIVIVLYLVRYWVQKRNNKWLTPVERARAELQNLKSTAFDFALFEDQKKYTSSLSEIMRTFIEEEIGIEALESTSKELLVKAQKNSDFPVLLLEDLESFGKKTDLVKFARIPIAKSELDFLEKFVEKVLVSVQRKPQEEQQK